MSTTINNLTTTQKLYRDLENRGRDVSFIANVLLTGCGKPAKRMKALKDLLDAGNQITTASFTMPYEALVFNGRTVLAMPLLDRGEAISYTKENYLAECRRS